MLEILQSANKKKKKKWIIREKFARQWKSVEKKEWKNISEEQR